MTLNKYFLLPIAFLFSLQAFCQSAGTEDNRPVYLRYPTVPLFTVYQAPDSTAFTRDNLKKKPTIFFIFSPECGHCKHETEMMLKNINKLKHVQILMITYFPYEEMMDFYKAYNIKDYPQITMARDPKFFFPTYFQVKNFPSFYIYDKKGNFKEFLEGDIKIDTLLNALNK